MFFHQSCFHWIFIFSSIPIPLNLWFFINPASIESIFIHEFRLHWTYDFCINSTSTVSMIFSPITHFLNLSLFLNHSARCTDLLSQAHMWPQGLNKTEAFLSEQTTHSSIWKSRNTINIFLLSSVQVQLVQEDLNTEFNSCYNKIQLYSICQFI